MSNKGPATEGVLGDLHSKVAKVMSNALDNIQKQQDEFDATEHTDDSPAIAPELNPALLSVMVRFLDANKITCVPEAGNEMSELATRLANKRKRKSVGNIVQLHELDE